MPGSVSPPAWTGPTWTGIVVAVACLAALAPWPYGYYQLLRLVVTGYAVWIAYGSADARRRGWAWPFGLLALLYNPLFVIHMSRDLHAVVNLATAAIVLSELWVRRRALTVSGSSAPRG